MTLRHRDRIGGDLVIEVAFTESALDLGDRAEPAVRAESLAAVRRATGAEPIIMRQVHGPDVEVVDDLVGGPTTTPPTCDALVATGPGVALLARAADCVPVLLADPGTGVIAAVHSGRQGLSAGVVPAAVERMRSLGADRVVGWLGPHVCGSCYEVPDEMRAEVTAVVPEAWSTTGWGTPALDLGAGVRAQLSRSGVDEVRQVGSCTREDDSWPSYRRDGAAATRFAGVIWSHT